MMGVNSWEWVTIEEIEGSPVFVIGFRLVEVELTRVGMSHEWMDLS